MVLLGESRKGRLAEDEIAKCEAMLRTDDVLPYCFSSAASSDPAALTAVLLLPLVLPLVLSGVIFLVRLALLSQRQARRRTGKRRRKLLLLLLLPFLLLLSLPCPPVRPKAKG